MNYHNTSETGSEMPTKMTMKKPNARVICLYSENSVGVSRQNMDVSANWILSVVLQIQRSDFVQDAISSCNEAGLDTIWFVIESCFITPSVSDSSDSTQVDW